MDYINFVIRFDIEVSTYLHIEILFGVIKGCITHQAKNVSRSRVTSFELNYCEVNLNNLNPIFLFTNKNINPIRDHLSITSGSENSNFC